MSDFKKQRQSVWSEYWSKGVISSCASAIASENSDLQAFWLKCSELIQADDVLVDLCTGKGAVIRSLLDSIKSQGKDIKKCYGVDIVSYKYDNNYAFEACPGKVELLLNTPIEAIPLEDNSVTRFVSQFGIEYTLSDKFYLEIARLLRTGGSIHAVLHHKNSVLCKVAQEEIRQIDWLINELQFINLARELTTFFAMLKNPANAGRLKSDKKATRLREKYNTKAALINKQINLQPYNSILKEALDIVSQSFQMASTQGKKQATKLLDGFLHELEGSKFRSQELLQAALDKKKVQSLIGNFEKNFQLDFEFSELNSNDQLVAWGLTITRVLPT